MERRTFRYPELQPEGLPSLWEELGIPQERDIFLFQQWCPHGSEWKGYFFDLVGTHEIPADPTDAPRFWLFNPPGDLRQPWYTARDDNTYNLDTPTPPLIAWRRRVVYQQAPPWIEMRWHPETGVSEALYPDLTPLRRGRQLLRRLTSPGRPVGTFARTDSDVLDDIKNAVASVRKSGKKITKRRVAEEMHHDRGYLDRALKRLHLTFNDVEKQQ